MKALFYFIATIFLAWVGVVYILPQTEFSARVHQAVEERAGRGLGGVVKIETLRFGFYPTLHMKFDRAELKHKQAEVFVPKGEARFVLSALWKKRKAWVWLDLQNPKMLLVQPKASQLLLGAIGAEFIRGVQVSNGTLGTLSRRRVANKINGTLDKINGAKIQSSFFVADLAYQATLSLGEQSAAPQSPLEFKLTQGENTLHLEGTHTQNQFAGTLLAGTLHLRRNKVELKSKITANLDQDIEAHLSNATLSGFGWAVQGAGKLEWKKGLPLLSLSIKKGTGTFQGLKLSKVKGALRTNFIKAQVKNFNATTAGGSVQRGGLKIKKEKTIGQLNLTTTNLKPLLARISSAFLPLELSKANVAVDFALERNAITQLKARGSMDGGLVDFKLNKKEITTRWKTKNASTITRALGLPHLGAARGSGKVLMKVNRTKQQVRVQLLLGKESYGALGTFKRGVFDGKVRINSIAARGTGRVLWAQHKLDANLNLQHFVLSPRQAASWRSWMKFRPTTLRLRATRAKFSQTQFKNFYASLYATKNNVRVREVRGQFGGGTIEAAADLSAKNKHSLVLKLSNVKSEFFTQKFFNKKFVEGRMDFFASLSTSGAQSQWWANLNGTGQVDIKRGNFVGFDAGLLNQALPQLELFSLLGVVVDYAFTHGTTSFVMGKSKFSIQDGMLKAAPISFSNDNVQGRLALSVDLTRQKIEAQFGFKLPLRPDYPSFDWQLQGKWGKPVEHFNTIGFERALVRDIVNGGIEEIRVEANIQKLPEELENLLQEARNNPSTDKLDLDLELDITSELQSPN